MRSSNVQGFVSTVPTLYEEEEEEEDYAPMYHTWKRTYIFQNILTLISFGKPSLNTIIINSTVYNTNQYQMSNCKSVKE